MAFDELLAARIRKVLSTRNAVTERKMFGGIAFMVHGNMCCGVVSSDLTVRVGPERYEQLLGEPGARPMDFTGRPMKGMLYVDGATCANGRTLATRVKRGADFAASLPGK
jgi:TfoX/Sxy family transcriptional regulator of competence genes